MTNPLASHREQLQIARCTLNFASEPSHMNDSELWDTCEGSHPHTHDRPPFGTHPGQTFVVTSETRSRVCFDVRAG